ncbi:MAG: threonine--tRNA ligase [Oligoflexia bacterium]|nr:threonine--tRNA ligase [Oligoflexia bacterium]
MEVKGDEKLYKIRHSLAHVLAQAVLQIRPGAKLAFGPPVDDGFYYDFMFDEPLTPDLFPDIEKRMRKIIAERQEFVASKLSSQEAIAHLKKLNQNFKAEYCEELAAGGEKEIGFYTNGPFEDMCAGPHLKHTGEIPPDCFKIDTLAGAYWRGSEKNPQLTRIYGLAFSNRSELDAFVKRREEAKKRDHRRLGQELAIFTFSDEVGQGLPLWMPNGTVMRDELEKLGKEEERRDGYVRVATPHLTKDKLYYRSGHLPFYKSDMYSPLEIDGEQFYLKPMNCPHHHQIYLAQPHSYRELPLRLAEYGQCYRYENSGALSGLMRVRGFCQNDSHIYCRFDQAKEEFLKVMRLHARYYDLMGIKEYYMRFSKPDLNKLDKYVNEPQKWLAAMKIVKEAMDESGYPYVEAEGEAAFYGPKIDFMIKSVIGVEYAISTNQLDFLATERFGLTYTGEDGKDHPVYVIHRAPLGSHERFIAFLIEQYAGSFPTWLSPVQAMVIPIADRHNEYGRKVYEMLRNADVPTAYGGVRVEIDESRESMQKKIRNAQMRKIPYMLIAGDNEARDGTVSVRLRSGQDLKAISLEKFMQRITQEVKQRRDLVSEAVPAAA